jgi:hypothetical protein
MISLLISYFSVYLSRILSVHVTVSPNPYPSFCCTCLPSSAISIFVLVNNTLYPWTGIAQSVSDWLRAGRQRGRSSSPGSVKNFLFSTSSRPAVGSTKFPIQWIPGAFSPGVKRPECEADHLQLVSRSRKCGSIHPFPHTPSWRIV